MNTRFPHELRRTVVIGARPEDVFRFFTDNARWAAWWGTGSTIDAKPGGRVFIRYPDGTEAVGEVVDLTPPTTISFTYGYVTGKPVAPGESQVTIRLEPTAEGTQLELVHGFADAAPLEHHVQGWRYQLSLFANAVANELHAGAESRVDDWFATWSNPDAGQRSTSLDRLVSSDVTMRDRFSLVSGMADLRAHLDAVHRFMPGMQLLREGPTRHCQGAVLADWIARSTDGQTRARGTNLFQFNAGGRIESVMGFWG